MAVKIKQFFLTPISMINPNKSHSYDWFMQSLIGVKIVIFHGEGDKKELINQKFGWILIKFFILHILEHKNSIKFNSMIP